MVSSLLFCYLICCGVKPGLTRQLAQSHPLPYTEQITLHFLSLIILRLRLVLDQRISRMLSDSRKRIRLEHRVGDNCTHTCPG